MEELFKYLHLLNEARATDSDTELYNRQQKVCDAIEKELGIQENKEQTIVNNYHTTNNHQNVPFKAFLPNAIDCGYAPGYGPFVTCTKSADELKS